MIQLQVVGRGNPREVAWAEVTQEMLQVRATQTGAEPVALELRREIVRAQYAHGFVFHGVKLAWDAEGQLLTARPWNGAWDGPFPGTVERRPHPEPGALHTETLTTPRPPAPADDDPDADDVDPRIRALVALRRLWLELRNAASDEQIAFVLGGIAMSQACGLLTSEQAELWQRRIKACPGHDDEGGRDWCAYGCSKAQMS